MTIKTIEPHGINTVAEEQWVETPSTFPPRAASTGLIFFNLYAASDITTKFFTK